MHNFPDKHNKPFVSGEKAVYLAEGRGEWKGPPLYGAVVLLIFVGRLYVPNL